MQADTIAGKTCDEVAAPAAREQARITHRARLNALRQLGEAREALIDTALDQTRGRLSGLRADEIYPTVYRHLVEEALSALNVSAGNSPKVFLQVDPRDQKLLEAHLKQLEWEVPVNYDLECWGGVIAKSEDHRVIVINTLEARLDKAAAYLRRYLAALFEEEAVIMETDHKLVEMSVH
jgi:vacuolar-type H+-ATPase subunit E/Vma4